MTTIALAIFLIVFGMVAAVIGIVQLGPVLVGLFMLAGGMWFISLGLYGLQQQSAAPPSSIQDRNSP